MRARKGLGVCLAASVMLTLAGPVDAQHHKEAELSEWQSGLPKCVVEDASIGPSPCLFKGAYVVYDD